MRGLPILGVLAALAACSSEPAGPGAAASQAAGAEDDSAIECALRGAEKFVRECAIERAPQGDVLYLVVRHPDGGFRRFEVLKDGRGIGAADGAETAETKIDGDMLEVTVAKDRYRFPATRKQHAPAS